MDDPFSKYIVDFGGSGPLIHFAHANGYPPECYQSFIKPFLNSYQVKAFKYRPLWGGQDHTQLKNWHNLADDLIQFLDSQKLKGIIGMGHSLGGTTSVIAAMKRPDLFSKLILLDPVIFDNFYLRIAGLLPHSIRKRLIPVAKIATRRKDTWKSRDEVFQSWRTKKIFGRISDEVLQQIIQYAVVLDSQGKVRLAYSKEWETQVYITAPLIFHQLKKLKTPLIVVKGENTDVISSEVWQDWQRAQPRNVFIDFKATGHLLPFEKPEELAQMILSDL